MKKYRLLLSVGLFSISFFSCIRYKIDYEFTLNSVEISAVALKKSDNIRLEQDSVRAMAMLLNRECPECSLSEKVYVASCLVTGSKSLNVDWKTYLFDLKQFWGFDDPRIKFDPDEKNHRENLLASEMAWKSPKKVRFYASQIDGHHFKMVKAKGFKPKGFYHYYSYSL